MLKNTKSSSEAALRASEAYEKIVKAIEDALKAYDKALEAAKIAHNLVTYDAPLLYTIWFDFYSIVFSLMV